MGAEEKRARARVWVCVKQASKQALRDEPTLQLSEPKKEKAQDR